MKRIISLILIGAVLFSFISCATRTSSRAPTYTYLYNNGESHQAIGEYLGGLLSEVGIRLNLKNQEWGTFLSTRKSGNFTIARNGWVADYSDPISFLDMWTSDSGNNDVGFGKNEHAKVSIYNIDLRDYGYDLYVKGGTWAQTYDELIAVIKKCTDEEIRFSLMHLAEDMIMDTGCIMPIYFYTDIYMIDKNIDGFYSSPLGYKFFKNCRYLDKDSISVSLSSEPSSMDPAFSSTVDSATMISHLFSGLAKWDTDDSGNAVLAADCAEKLVEGVENEDGSIKYIYQLKNGIKWSDGSSVTAYDFEFAWKRAASKELGADYGYMFEVIKGYDEGNLAVEAVSESVLEVTLETRISYWNELLAFPTFMPVKSDAVKNEGWATDAKSYISNGAYVMESWEHNGCISIKENEYNREFNLVSMPRVKFYLSDDANNMLTNFKNRSWQLIDTIPTNEIKALKESYPDEVKTIGQIGTYYLSFSINTNILASDENLSANEREIASSEIRKAISLLIDRQYICDYITKAGQIPASSFVALGIKNPDGSEFYETAGNNIGFAGYFDVSYNAYRKNAEYALSVLEKYYGFKKNIKKY